MRELKKISSMSRKHVDIILSHMTLIDRMKVAYSSNSKQMMLEVTDKIRQENRNKTVGLFLGNKYDICLNVAKHFKCLHQVPSDIFCYEKGNKEDYLWLDEPLPAAPPAVPNPCNEIKMTSPALEAQRYANEIANQIHPPIVKNSAHMHDEWLKTKDSLWDTKYFKPTEETPMRFVTIEKQLLVNGENVLALNAEQLTTRISELKKRQDELYVIPFSSKRIAKEIDKLDAIMNKLIKRLDRM